MENTEIFGRRVFASCVAAARPRPGAGSTSAGTPGARSSQALAPSSALDALRLRTEDRPT